MFRSEQGVIPGSEPQNYDDILRKQKVFSQCTQELLWLQARHVKNTEEFGTPYVCDHGYNKILHRVLKDCLKLLSSLTDLSIRTIAFRQMEKDV